MSSTPKASDQPLPQLYHLEHDKVPSQLQQHVQIDSIDLNRPNNDHIKNRSINVIGIDLPELNETNTVSIDLPETCKESHTMIDSRDLEDKNIQEDLPPDEPSNVHLKSTIITKPPGTNKIAPDSIIAEAKTIEVASKASSETGSTVPELSQADDSSDLLLSSALECDEMYIDRSTSSIDLDAGIKSDSGALSAAIDDDCLSEKESPYSGDAVSEDRTSLNDLDGEFECDKDEDVEFDISSGAKVLSLDLVRQVIEKLRRCRSRTDKPRIVRILQKTCNLSRQKVVAFLTQAIDQNHIERFRYREYYGLRLVGSGGASGKDDGKEPGTPYDDKDDSLMGDSSGSGLLDTIMKLLHESLAEHKNGVDCDTILKILQDQPSTSGQVTLKQVKMLMQEQVEKKNGNVCFFLLRIFVDLLTTFFFLLFAQVWSRKCQAECIE